MTCPVCDYNFFDGESNKAYYWRDACPEFMAIVSTMSPGRPSQSEPDTFDIFRHLRISERSAVYVKVHAYKPGKFYVGSTESMDRRYSRRKDILDLRIVYPVSPELREKWEQATINLLTDLGMPLGNDRRAHPDKVSYIMLPDELVELCRRFAREVQ